MLIYLPDCSYVLLPVGPSVCLQSCFNFVGYERDSIFSTISQIASSKGNSLGTVGEPLGIRWCNMAGGLSFLSTSTAAAAAAAAAAVIPDSRKENKVNDNVDNGNHDVRLSGEDWVAASAPPPKIVIKGVEIVPSAGAVLVHTMGRLSSLLSPRDAVALNLEHFSLLFIADMSQNDSSYRRQNSTDNVKQLDEIAMESPLVMAAALSLAGAGSLVIHR